MITRRQFCMSQIRKFIADNSLEMDFYMEDMTRLIPYIGSSTTLGVCLEYLGILTKKDYPEDFNYLASRGGVFQVGYDEKSKEVNILTVREFLAMLPEEISASSTFKPIVTSKRSTRGTK